MSYDELKAENAHLKKLLRATDMFLNAAVHLSMENWEPALKARIEALTSDNWQLDDAYTKARALLDNELAELRVKNMRLEREADWLADRLVDLCQNRYAPDCRVMYDPEVASRKLFREAAQCQTR